MYQVMVSAKEAFRKVWSCVSAKHWGCKLKVSFQSRQKLSAAMNDDAGHDFGKQANQCVKNSIACHLWSPCFPRLPRLLRVLVLKGLWPTLGSVDVRYADGAIVLVVMVAINCFITLEVYVESVCGSPPVCSIVYGNVE